MMTEEELDERDSFIMKIVSLEGKLYEKDVEIAYLKKLCGGFANRIHKQSEMLSKMAEKKCTNAEVTVQRLLG